MPTPPASKLDANQVLTHSFDDISGRIRVDAVTSPAGGSTEVSVNMVDDSIKIGDGVNYFTGTTIGPKTGLDVNIITPLAISIDSSSDSILVVGTEDGTPSGTQHVIATDTDGSVFTKTLNNLIHKKYDTVQITAKTTNGPTAVVYRDGGLSGTIVATAALTYDIDGDFQTITVVE